MKKIYRFLRNIKYRLQKKKYKINPYSYSYLCSRLSTIKNIESVNIFDHYHNSEHKKRRILIRHDIDLDISTAFQMARIEKKYGLTSTYFILHSAKYFKTRLPETLNIAREIQSMGHGIGLHNNLITDYFQHNIKPSVNLTKVLQILRDNGLTINGSASHGSKFINHLNSQLINTKINVTNYLIFEELFEKKRMINPDFSKLSTIKYNNTSLKLPCFSMKEYKLHYEDYFLKSHYYISDTGRKFWYAGSDPIETVKTSKYGETIKLLLHPVWWKFDL